MIKDGTLVRIVVDQYNRNAIHREHAQYHGQIGVVVAARRTHPDSAYYTYTIQTPQGIEFHADGDVVQVLPQPGMVATYTIGSDRYVTHVQHVSKSGHQVLTEDGELYTRRPDLRYRRAGSQFGIVFGVEAPYTDPSF